MDGSNVEKNLKESEKSKNVNDKNSNPTKEEPISLDNHKEKLKSLYEQSDKDHEDTYGDYRRKERQDYVDMGASPQEMKIYDTMTDFGIEHSRAGRRHDVAEEAIQKVKDDDEYDKVKKQIDEDHANNQDAIYKKYGIKRNSLGVLEDSKKDMKLEQILDKRHTDYVNSGGKSSTNSKKTEGGKPKESKEDYKARIQKLMDKEFNSDKDFERSVKNSKPSKRNESIRKKNREEGDKWEKEHNAKPEAYRKEYQKLMDSANKTVNSSKYLSGDIDKDMHKERTKAKFEKLAIKYGVDDSSSFGDKSDKKKASVDDSKLNLSDGYLQDKYAKMKESGKLNRVMEYDSAIKKVLGDHNPVPHGAKGSLVEPTKDQQKELTKVHEKYKDVDHTDWSDWRDMNKAISTTDYQSGIKMMADEVMCSGGAKEGSEQDKKDKAECDKNGEIARMMDLYAGTGTTLDILPMNVEEQKVKRVIGKYDPVAKEKRQKEMFFAKWDSYNGTMQKAVDPHGVLQENDGSHTITVMLDPSYLVLILF